MSRCTCSPGVVAMDCHEHSDGNEPLRFACHDCLRPVSGPGPCPYCGGITEETEGNENDTWEPDDAAAERILADMRVDRLVEIVRGELGERQVPLPDDAPVYMRLDARRQAEAHIALDELAERAST